MVTREYLGMRYSNLYFDDGYLNDEKQEYFRKASYIGGDSHAIPKYQSYYWRNKIGGMALENLVSLAKKIN